MIILSVDYGDARTGLAVCDKFEMLARPLCVIHETDHDKLLEKILAAVKENRVETVVWGNPINMNGSYGERSDKCKDLARRFEELSGVPVVLWDERSTTVEAHNILNVTDTRGKNRKKVIDAVAATLILENYLSYRKNNK